MPAIRIAAVAAGVSLCPLIAAHAATRALTRVDRDAPSFVSLNEAARAALAVAMTLSNRFEFGGVVVECAGSYRFSTPVTSGRTDRIEFDAVIPRRCALAALYHTHPGAGGEPTRFSADDVRTARELKVHSYIGVLLDGSVHVFEPSMRVATDRVRMGMGATAEGELVPAL